MKRSYRRFFILLAVLVLAMVLLSACGGVNSETGAYQPGILEVLAKPLRDLLVFFHNKILIPLGVRYAWGWAIILVAVLIRLLLLPLSIRQMRSMREASVKMKLLQPELDALKKKYPKDKQKLQEEQMKLYQRHGITQAQMAGCLPTLLQLPILLAFYYALVGLIPANAPPEPFFFIPNLWFPEYGSGLAWLTQGLPQTLITNWPYLVLPALLGITQVMTVRSSQQNQPAMSSDTPGAGMMGQMTWIMTAFFVYFSLTVPSAMSLYWVVGNVLALLQQVYINRQSERWQQQITDSMQLAPALVSGDVGAGDDKPAALTTSKPLANSSNGATASDDTTRRKRRRRR